MLLACLRLICVGWTCSVAYVDSVSAVNWRCRWHKWLRSVTAMYEAMAVRPKRELCSHNGCRSSMFYVVGRCCHTMSDVDVICSMLNVLCSMLAGCASAQYAIILILKTSLKLKGYWSKRRLSCERRSDSERSSDSENSSDGESNVEKTDETMRCPSCNTRVLFKDNGWRGCKKTTWRSWP